MPLWGKEIFLVLCCPRKNIFMVFTSKPYYARQAVSEGLHDTVPVEIVSTAAQLYKNSHLKWLAIGE